MKKLGWTPEEAMVLKKRDKYQNKIIKIAGEVFLSLRAAAEHYGINYKVAWARNNSGWPIEAVLSLLAPPNEKLRFLNITVDQFRWGGS